MKTLKSLLLICGFALVSQLALAQIAGTAHDFELAAWNPTDEICVVCHTPHNADLTVVDAPLWNHEVTATTFTLYSGTSTFNAGVLGTITQPDGSSKLCLSCHDGTVAIENFGAQAAGTNFMATINADADFGTNLSDDHPISFTYDAALVAADGELWPIATSSGLGGTIEADMLFSGKVQCASCHDVHGTGIDYLLRKSNSGSALCLTCHDK